jgi:aerobic-type carbon monoxide dehydrogenase small subunit (CoxS/CutS family)
MSSISIKGDMKCNVCTRPIIIDYTLLLQNEDANEREISKLNFSKTCKKCRHLRHFTAINKMKNKVEKLIKEAEKIKSDFLDLEFDFFCVGYDYSNIISND